ncbi:MAG: chorismate mutase [Candidatus Woesearchaeota archaeon]|nr:chorismate mutase [Candidatus Woesearchaeota archaeon]
MDEKRRKHKEIRKQRKRIDSIDSKIIKLLSGRVVIGKKLGKLKKSKGLRITDRARERDVSENAKAIAKHHDLEPEFVEELFRKIVKYTREKQK